MPATRKKKAVENLNPTTPTNPRNTPDPFSPAPIAPIGTPVLPPPYTTSGRYTRANSLSIGAFSSDTTQWDPSMVTPSKMNPSYRPSPVPSTPGHDLRSRWASTPPKVSAFLQRQKLARSQQRDATDSHSTIVVDSSAVGITRGLETPIPGTNTLRTLPPTAPAAARRMTRSSIYMQPELLVSSEKPLETVRGPGQPSRNLVEDLASHRALVVGMPSPESKGMENSRTDWEGSQVTDAEKKESKNTTFKAAVGRNRVPVQLARLDTPVPGSLVHQSHSRYLERLPMGLPATVNQAQRHLADLQVTDSQTPKRPALLKEDPMVTIESPSRRNMGHFNHANGSQPGVPLIGGSSKHDSSLGYPERTLEESFLTINHVPERCEQIAEEPLIVDNCASSVGNRTENSPWATPTSSPVSVPGSQFGEDLTNPSYGTTPPGNDNSDDSNPMEPWIFLQSHKLLELARPLSNLEPGLETPPASSTRSEDIPMEDTWANERTTGSTLTSYSQRPGSPTSLICMYKVHGNLYFSKRRGISLLHTKRKYDGEKALLDLDLPVLGGLMEVEEVERLMVAMINGKLGAEIRLASVDREWENRMQHSAVMKSVRLG